MRSATTNRELKKAIRSATRILQQRLNSFGHSASEAGVAFLSLKCTGMPHRAGNCPLAVHLTKAVNKSLTGSIRFEVFVDGSSAALYHDGFVVERLPFNRAVTYVVKLFDSYKLLPMIDEEMARSIYDRIKHGKSANVDNL